MKTGKSHTPIIVRYLHDSKLPSVNLSTIKESKINRN